MRNRFLIVGTLASAIVVATLADVSVAGQTTSSKPAVTSAAPAKTAFTHPKTPWGDPDLQGVWTSDAARGIARERPKEFASQPFLTDEEFAKKVAQDKETQRRAENAVGAFRNDGAWLVKSFRRRSLIIAPEDGRIPNVTPWAETRRAPRDRGTFGEGPFEATEDFTLYDRCITRGVVGSILPVVYGNGNQILQTPGQVVITYEMIHDTRIIPLDGRPRTGIRSYLGEPRGRWEGHTLIVETINFTDKTSVGGGNGNGLRHSQDLKLTERFTRTDDDLIEYEVTIDDPKTYAKPWRVWVPLVSPPGFQLFAYECHEGNYMLPAVLSGERAEDRRIAEAAAKGIVVKRKPVQFNNNAAPTEEGPGR